jgi:chromosome partitioning protein
MLEMARMLMLDPQPRKAAPVFSAAQIAALCGIEKARANYLLMNQKDIPTGRVVDGKRKREFTLAEAQEWVRRYGKYTPRPEGARAFTIATGNFKGGVSKTTTTMALAQGLTLRGMKGLIIDLDPQGSITQMCDYIPIKDVTESDTVLPLIYGQESSIEYAIRPTYWDGIDLVPATPALFNAEFFLPTAQIKSKTFEFWDVINKGIDSVRDKYDFIIFDTPPALSYLTTNAFYAADGLIVPMQPEALSFASSSQFWSLITDLTSAISEHRPELAKRKYAFINVLITMASTQQSTDTVSGWIRQTYGNKVVPMAVPDSEAVKKSATFFGTVYDTQDKIKSATVTRIREAYDSLSKLVETQIREVWEREQNNG